MLADDRGGRAVTDAERLVAFKKLAESGNLQTLVPLLPLLLNLDSKPYSLQHHYQFEPMFRTRRPKKTLLITGRQVAKTTYEAADGVVQSLCIPNLKTLYVTPLFEQARRLSTDRVRKFIDQSPVRHLFSNSKTENSVLRKTFSNGSVMHFSFALLDADRTRGISADKICYDEIQDMDRAHIPVINECMSHSWLKIVQFAGTPKTPENTISGLFNQSSQAEWVIPCRACHKDNFCSTEFDLDAIIGPTWDPGEGNPFLGTICANPACRRLIDPADGFWMHRYPERRWDFAGYHIPQPIMHIHYSDPEAWRDLVNKREGGGNYTPAKYFNEVLGEACGTGVQLVSMEELKAASNLPWANDPRDYTPALQHARKYSMRVLAIDWGGGGEDEISLTTMAVLGYLPNGQIHVIWARRLMTPHDHMGEAQTCLDVFKAFKCNFMAHDYTGAGSLRETFLVHNHPDLMAKIIPIAYNASKAVMTFKPATDIHPRNHWLVDKTRSLLLTCACVKLKQIRFFKYDYQNADNPGLVHDFLGLVENKVATHRAGDLYTIQRHAQLSDDFAQAVNIGCCALWHVNQKWPNLGQVRQLAISEEQLRAAVAQRDSDWEQPDPGVLGVPH